MNSWNKLILEMADVNFEIKVVESVSKYNRDISEKAMKGGLDRVKGIVMTPETFSKVFSPERIKLLQRIRRNNAKNIYQLAKDLEKPYEVVFRNVKYLEGIGLIRLVNRDNKKIPHLTSKISIDMFSSEAEA
ncbi:hypothetical protein J4212_02690 [Candidatus Woesearchaeota archaeon]|nr:hypothetical protein [Candidatus Woesearchaeota archaeon]